MSKRQPVIYSNVFGVTYLFSEDGVRVKRTSKINPATDFDGMDDFWSLVDTRDEEPVPLSVTSALPLYFVFTTPQHGRFKTLLDDGVSLWVMDLWSDEELYSL